jgi:hypothetical protein
MEMVKAGIRIPGIYWAGLVTCKRKYMKTHYTLSKVSKTTT